MRHVAAMLISHRRLQTVAATGLSSRFYERCIMELLEQDENY